MKKNNEKSYIIFGGYNFLPYIYSVIITQNIINAMNTQLTSTAYSTIANNILSNLPDENKSYEVEVEIENLTYFVDVVYSVVCEVRECSTDRGTQVFDELTGEDIYISDIVVYDNDADTEYFATDKEINKLYTMLN